MFGQLFRPAQETGIKRAESMASHQQTPIQHYPELNMSNGNSLYGSDGANFSRLTEHLVFAFLGGCVSMDDLPCLGDLANETEGPHLTTLILMDSHSKSSKAKSLDPNDNLHQLSAISMDLDFNSRIVDYPCESVDNNECCQNPVENVLTLLDTFDASSTAYSPPEHTSQSSDENVLLAGVPINALLICNKFVKDILNLDHPTPSMPFQQCDFTGIFFLSTTDNGSHFDSLGSNNGPDILFEKLAFNLQKINVNRTTGIQEYALTNHHELNSENFDSPFHRHHKNLNDFPVSDPFSTPAWNNEPTNDENTFAIPNPGTLMDYLCGDLEICQFLNAESSGSQLEDSCCTIGNNGEEPTFSVPDPSQLMNFLYGDLESPVFLSSESIEEDVPIYAKYDGNDSKVDVVSGSADHTIGESYQCSTMHSSAINSSTSCDQKVCLLGDCGSNDDAEVADPSDCTLNNQCCGAITSNALNLPIESKNGSLAGGFGENEVIPIPSVSVGSSFFDLSDHENLLELYGLSNQEQYTDTSCTCASPTWPEEMITVSEGQTQKPLTFLIPNLTKNDNSNETSTADSSLFHSNTDETSVMNKNWTDEIYERKSENSASLCHLNQMECAFETSSFHYDFGSTDCVLSCSDGFEDSIEHQSFENDKNNLKFEFPDPRTLKDYFFGSLDSPKFLAAELQNIFDYPSIFGYCEQSDRTEVADLSDIMLLDQCCDDGSINKFSCSIQLLDLSSYPFDISDHDELLERYGIKDQDQFIDGNWACDSPTWLGKV